MSTTHIRSVASFALAVIMFSGQFLDQTTSQPLAHVNVHLSGPATASTTTNTQGRFAFRSLRPGTYTVEAESNDVPPQTFHVTLRRNRATVLNVTLCSTTLDYHCATPND